MEEEKFKEEKEKRVNQLVTSLVFLVFPLTGYFIFQNKLFQWLLTVAVIYALMSLIVLPIWLSKNKPK